MMRKNLRQSILKSLGRYIAIIGIIALGAGMFVGLLSTRSDMIATCQWYTEELNMFDLRLISTYGWSQQQVDSVRELDTIAAAEGLFSVDALMRRENAEEDSVVRVYRMPEEINRLYLVSGRLPERPNECVVDSRYGRSAIGSVISVSQDNDADTVDAFAYDTYTVVGKVNSPLYMNMDRGNTSVGNGSIGSFLFIPAEGLSADYFTEIHVTIPGDYYVYSDAYNNAMDDLAEVLKEEIKPLADARFEQVRTDAEQAYADGMQEYEDGVQEYNDSWDDAMAQLDEAEEELKNGEAEIEENRQTLLDGEQQLTEGQQTIDENVQQLLDSRKALAAAKSDTYNQLAQANNELLENYKTVNANLHDVENGLIQIDAGLVQLNSGIAQLESGLNQLDSGVSQIDVMISVLDISIRAAQSTLDMAKDYLPEEEYDSLAARLDELRGTRADYEQQKSELLSSREGYAAQLEDLKSQRDSVMAQREELQSAKTTLEAALDAINLGFLETQNGQTQADNQFAAAEGQLDAAQMQLNIAQRELDLKKAELEDGKKQLADAQRELDDGWEEFRQAKQDALDEFAEAKQKLDDAAQELADARATIDDMSDPSVYVLTRNTNVGYVTFESNADIVAGVSRVFPAFFLLVAAMVCITTMTRMVDDERMEIGTLKAMGYGNGEIASKYLIYAGSAAVLGCGVGVIAGSVAFPQILWQAYCIMLNVTDWVVLQFNWPLCIAVLAAYTGITLLVTWYCCRKEMRDVPAELIRPKPPAAGKKVILELLPFWNKISFLNKVAIRNIFRYRQRLAMMLLGIGGCTALLVTGFGIRDSIVDIVSIQFENVTKYDIGVTFSGNRDAEQQAQFREELRGDVDRILFCHQSSMELDAGGKTKDVNFIAADPDLTDFVDLHNGNQKIAVPGIGEALVSIGAAMDMGIEVGDTVTVRDPDMRSLTLTVSGVYDNNVYNYVIVQPQTVSEQWGEMPKIQTAFINVRESQDVHAAGAKVTGMSGIMNVTVNQDLADSVGSMMAAMDLVVLTVVVCAGLLAIIVLYNLTNINITEREREIATIKVLGFNEMESSAYVFKENLVLSAMGAVFGLGLGRLLHAFVMSQIKIDMVWFQNRVTLMSFLWSIVLTMLSACVVCLIFYFRLDKINMAEALKSVE